MAGASLRAGRWAGLFNLGLWAAWLLIIQIPVWIPWDQTWADLAVAFASGLLGMAVCWGWLKLTLALQEIGTARRTAISAAALLAGAAASATLTALLRHVAVDNLLPMGADDQPQVIPLGLEVLNAWLDFGWIFFVYGGGAAAILTFSAAAERERRLAQAQVAAREAQLVALRLQISPHFLFNALNAVSELIAEDRSTEAVAVVTGLTKLFRAGLAEATGEMITLEEEFQLAAAYLAIEETRFADRLKVVIELPSELKDALAPRFLLQPLVENAGKYAVAPSHAPVTVRVAAQAAADRLRLRVEDDGPGAAAAPGLGLGLRNIAERLAALYGDEGQLSAGPTGRGFAAQVEFPLRRAGGDELSA